MKGRISVGRSLDDLKRFLKQHAGLQDSNSARFCMDWSLYWKPMSSVGTGVREIRVHCEGEWRVVHVATFPNAIYVLHAFAEESEDLAIRS